MEDVRLCLSLVKSCVTSEGVLSRRFVLGGIVDLCTMAYYIVLLIGNSLDTRKSAVVRLWS
jgi:hypothetical protein